MPDKPTTLRLLRRSAVDLVREVQQIPVEGVLWRPAEGEWSVHETLTHLRDVERMIFLERVRRVAAEENPFLPLFDESQYHKDHWNPEEPIGQILGDLTQDHAQLCGLLEGADWTRKGTPETRGPVSLEWLADYTLGHVREHLSQILRARLAYEVRPEVGG